MSTFRRPAAEPRVLAARLFGIEGITDVALVHEGVAIATSGGHAVDEALTALGAEGLVESIVPLDDSLESVFGYLVG